MRFHLFPLAMILLCSLPAAPLAGASDVCRFTIPSAVEGRWDMEVILFHRDGRFHHGYALTPGRDQKPHRVDVTPSRPIQWQTAAGRGLDVPDRMRNYYSYRRKKEFGRYKARYQAGEIKIAYPQPTPPVSWSRDRLTGFVDVLIAPVNQSNSSGRGPMDLAYRIRLDARGRQGSTLEGTATWWTYESRDDDYAPTDGKVTVELADARWDDDYWTPAPGTELAAGKDWPQARGPMLTGSAEDGDRPMVDHLDDARLVWVGEEIIGGGRGAVLSRGGFAMYPYAWQTIGYGGFAGVTVADGKVFQYLVHPDEEMVTGSEKIASNVYVQLGADPRTMANEHGMMRDTVLCLDARTGRTLWRFKSDRTFGKVRSGKGGIGMTACYHRGKVYARGQGGLYCLDADTGEMLWHKRGDRLGEAKVGYGPTGGWSHDESPVMIGGVLVMGHGKDESLAGIDPADGSLRWTHANIKGQNAVPTKVELDGREYIVVGGKESAKLSLIDPADGRILWRSDLLGPNHGSLCVWGDVVCGNAADRKKVKVGRAAAVRISAGGPRKLWASQQAGYPGSRAVPVVHRGRLLIDTREGFYDLDALTGRLRGQLPHIYKMTWGSHNWTWTVAANGRALTSGVLMFNAGENGLERMPGRLSLDLAGGYTCPIKPALVDGRLFVRLSDKLVCYDLRRDPAATSRTVEVTCHEAFASSLAEGDPVDLRVRLVDGRPASVSARWPEVVGPEAKEVAEKWVAWYKKPLPWRPYPAPDLSAEGGGIEGAARVPMGWHFENWTLAIQPDGDRWRGRYTRSVPAVDEPLAVGGAVTGRAFDSSRGPCVVLNLAEAGNQLWRSSTKQTVTVVIVRGQGTARGWAMAGRINGMAHEADPAGLTFGPDGQVDGKVTVIFRDDTYFHLNRERKTSVAATYEIRAKVSDGKVAGEYSGTFGRSWQRSGELTGSVSTERR